MKIRAILLTLQLEDNRGVPGCFGTIRVRRDAPGMSFRFCAPQAVVLFHDGFQSVSHFAIRELVYISDGGTQTAGGDPGSISYSFRQFEFFRTQIVHAIDTDGFGFLGKYRCFLFLSLKYNKSSG